MKPRLLLLLTLCAFTACGGITSPRIPKHDQELVKASQLNDREVEQRLQFLEERLDARRDYAWYWWHGWTAAYGLGIVIQSVRAGIEDRDAKQGDLAISAVKALGGTINLLLRPLQAMHGADAVRLMPGNTPEERRQQLAVAEAVLQQNAKDADGRYSILRHAINVGANVAAGLIVWQVWDDPSRGGRSAGVGIAVGEMQIWSQPWWPAGDWEEYERRFDAPRDDSAFEWRLAPTVGGLAFEARF